MSNLSQRTKNLAKMGVLAAISVVLVYLLHFPLIPAVSFLEYDPADISILLGTFAMGPFAGFILTVIASLIQGLTVSASSSWYGIVMHIIATGTFVLVAGCIYKHKKTKKRAILALVLGSLSMAVIMIPANLILTPLYMGAPREMVTALLPWIILFNIAKAGINSILTFFIYKRVSGLLHK